MNKKWFKDVLILITGMFLGEYTASRISNNVFIKTIGASIGFVASYSLNKHLENKHPDSNNLNSSTKLVQPSNSLNYRTDHAQRIKAKQESQSQSASK